MKKFLLLLVALIASVATTWADGVSAWADFQDGTAYTLTTSRGSAVWASSSDSYLKGTTEASTTLDATNPNHLFLVMKSSVTNRVYLYNIGAAKFVTNSENHAYVTSETPSEYWTVKNGGDTTYPIMFDSQSGNHWNFGGSGQITVDSWSTADAGNQFTVAATDYTVPTETTEAVRAAITAAESKFTVTTNIDGGGVIYNGTEYAKGSEIQAESITAEELTAITVDGYEYSSITIFGQTINVKYYNPLFKTDGTAYKLKYNSQYIDLTNTMDGDFGQNACLSENGSPLFFTMNADGSFYINNTADNTGNFLGSYYWDASIDPTNKAAWTFEATATGTSYYMHGPDGYVKSNATSNCPLYTDGAASAAKAFSIEELSSITYTVAVTGADAGAVTYNGNNYSNGETIEVPVGLKLTDLAAKAVENMVDTVYFNGTTINVKYSTAPIDLYVIGTLNNWTVADPSYKMTETVAGSEWTFDFGTTELVGQQFKINDGSWSGSYNIGSGTLTEGECTVYNDKNSSNIGVDSKYTSATGVIITLKKDAEGNFTLTAAGTFVEGEKEIPALYLRGAADNWDATDVNKFTRDGENFKWTLKMAYDPTTWTQGFKVADADYADYNMGSDGQTYNVTIGTAYTLATSNAQNLFLASGTEAGDYTFTLTKADDVWSLLVEKVETPEPTKPVVRNGKSYSILDGVYNQYWSPSSATVGSNYVPSDTPHYFAVTLDSDKATFVDQNGYYLGGSGWNAVTSESSFEWTIASVDDGNYSLYQSGTSYPGYAGGQTTKSKVYINNAAAIALTFTPIFKLTYKFVNEGGQSIGDDQVAYLNTGDAYPAYNTPEGATYVSGAPDEGKTVADADADDEVYTIVFNAQVPDPEGFEVYTVTKADGTCGHGDCSNTGSAWSCKWTSTKEDPAVLTLDLLYADWNKTDKQWVNNMKFADDGTIDAYSANSYSTTYTTNYTFSTNSKKYKVYAYRFNYTVPSGNEGLVTVLDNEGNEYKSGDIVYVNYADTCYFSLKGASATIKDITISDLKVFVGEDPNAPVLDLDPSKKYYWIEKTSGYYVKIDADKSSVLTLTDTPFEWTIAGSKKSFNFSDGEGTYVVPSSTSNWNIALDETAYDWTIAGANDGFTMAHQTNGKFVNTNGTYTTNDLLYYDKATGANFKIVATDEYDPTEQMVAALEASIEVAKANIGTELTYYDETKLNAAIAEARTAIDDPNRTVESIKAAKVAWETARDASMNQPVAGKVYQFEYLGYYQSSDLSLQDQNNYKLAALNVDKSDPSTMFEYDGTYLTSVATGDKLAQTGEKSGAFSTTATGATATDVKFVGDATTHTFFVVFNGGSRYAYGANGSARSDAGSSPGAPSTTSGYCWTVNEVTDVPTLEWAKTGTYQTTDVEGYPAHFTDEEMTETPFTARVEKWNDGTIRVRDWFKHTKNTSFNAYVNLAFKAEGTQITFDENCSAFRDYNEAKDSVQIYSGRTNLTSVEIDPDMCLFSETNCALIIPFTAWEGGNDGAYGESQYTYYLSWATPTAISSVTGAYTIANRDGKFIQNGRVVVVKNGKTYTTNGQLTK